MRELFLIGVCLLVVFGAVCFLAGYHNVDLTVNLIRLGFNGYDTTIGGLNFSLKDSYLNGIRLMWFGFFLVVACLFSILLVTFKNFVEVD